jgi:RNA polymerase sigma-70 factor, ECF subfamily
MNEKELINECKKYNPLAQKIVYKKYYSSFLRICIRYIIDKEEAKDIVQDGFLKIFSNVNKFKSEGSFEGWMKRIIINEALSYIKKKSKNKFEPISKFESESDNEPNEYPDILYEAENERKESLYSEKELLNAIHSLPESIRNVFNLVCIEEYSHKETGNLLNISEENSRARLMKARKMLREILETTSLDFKNSNYGR